MQCISGYERKHMHTCTIRKLRANEGLKAQEDINKETFGDPHDHL